MRVAAVDIGTNTVRLLVGEVDDGHMTEVVRDREITRLGQGVDADRRLDTRAVKRTVDAVRRFVERAHGVGAEHIRVAGTSALRDAADRAAFVRAIRDATGSNLEVLSGPDEGRLSFVGATSELPTGRYVVCDIGGGSTELAVGTASTSLDVGSVRLTERCLHGDPPSSEEIDRARGTVEHALDAAAGLGIGGHETLVGVAGTITTLAAVVLGLDAYDRDRVHHSHLSLSDVRVCSRRLLRMPVAGIRRIGCVEAGRADVIGAGSLILTVLMERFGFDDVLVSECDILDGLVLDLARALA